MLQQINILIGLLALMPAWVLLSQYRRTKNFDFLLFSGVFFSAAMGFFTTVLANIEDVLLIYKIQYLFINSLFLLLFWYSFRVISNINRIFLIIGVFWFVLLISLILFWQRIDHEETAKVLFWEMPNSYSSYFPKGAGITYNGSIIYSTGFRVVGDLFRVYVFVFNLYVYISVKPVVEKKELILAKRLWITSTVFLLLYSITILPWVVIPILPSLFNLIGLAIIGYLSVIIPEGLIISHAQMIRISELYDLVIEYDEELSTTQYENLMAYMKEIKSNI